MTTALAELNQAFSAFFDADRIQPRRPRVGHRDALVLTSDIAVA